VVDSFVAILEIPKRILNVLIESKGIAVVVGASIYPILWSGNGIVDIKWLIGKYP
jgi:hypothetical protein